MGFLELHSNMQDVMHDIDRTFNVLDGGGSPELYGGIVAVVGAGRRHGHHGRRQSEHESEVFLIRCFKNGNAHCWFKRPDLLEKVNKLLGEYYGAPIPEDRRPTRTQASTPKTAIAKNYGFFPTPDEAMERVMEAAPLYRRDEGEPKIRVLEPSAGTGGLAYAAVKRGAVVDCIEIHPARAEGLRSSKLYNNVIESDFLKVAPKPLYDVVLMNPPFDRERDIDHVMHALKVTAARRLPGRDHVRQREFRETRKAVAFRNYGQDAGSLARSAVFSSVSTNVNTVVLQGLERWPGALVLK